MLVDSHAHLDFVDDLKELLDRANGAGVSKIVTIGTSIECSKKCIEIAEKYSSDDLQIYATCGIHPEDGKADVGKYGDQLMSELGKVAKSSKKVVGIGECGLDYFLDSSGQRPDTSEQEKQFQRKLFGEQIRLAADLDLPLVVHCRNGWGEIFDLISKSQASNSKLCGVFHSWTGNVEAMDKALNLGFYISFSGIVTFKNAKDIQEVARKAPNGQVLVETDSPFLSPESLRGKKNAPENVRIIASFLSKIRNQSFDDIVTATSSCAQKLFNLW